MNLGLGFAAAIVGLSIVPAAAPAPEARGILPDIGDGVDAGPVS